MIERVKDATGLKAVMAATPALKHVYCDLDEWIAYDNNIAYKGEGENYGVFEYEYPGVYTGHYFFKDARGKTAFDLSKAILHKVFTDHGACLIRGLTPIDHKGALAMNRRLGFKPYGLVDTPAGTHEIYCLQAKDFNV